MPFDPTRGLAVTCLVAAAAACTAEWRFQLLEHDGQPQHHVAHHAANPSSLALPVVPGVEVPTELPDCKALRGQPCREVEELANEPFVE